MTSLSEVRDRATITVPEAGALLGLGRSAAYAAARAEQIPVVEIGERLVVPVPELLRMLGDTEAGSPVVEQDSRLSAVAEALRVLADALETNR